MSDQTLISYAQNGEDVVLLRALGQVVDGRYVDVGACDPVELSVTKALYDRGWRGIDIDPVPEYAQRLLAARPGNEVVQAAVTDRRVDTVTFHQLVGTGLSTLVDDTAHAHEQAGYERREITVRALTLDEVCDRSAVLETDLHLLKVDVEGAEAEVLRSFDLRRWRPWVVVVEATRPLSTEPSHREWEPLLTDAGYTCVLFDGISRYYVSQDHAELVDKLSYPACALDDYVTARQHAQDLRVSTLAQDLATVQREGLRWRGEAVGYWARAVAQVQVSEEATARARDETRRLRRQLAKSKQRLELVTAERRRMRARIQRLSKRVEVLETRSEPPRPAARVRGVARRMIGR